MQSPLKKNKKSFVQILKTCPKDYERNNSFQKGGVINGRDDKK